MFVFPMAGDSRRFREAGLGAKFMLPLGTGYVFDHAVAGFSAYFATDGFLFVLRREAEDFVRRRCGVLGIAQPRIVLLEHPTGGQAETVLLGLDQAAVADDRTITIFNIDTFRPGYRKPDFSGDGYLEVFEGEGDNWSFVRPDPAVPGKVAQTAEKRPLSRLCCTGLYQFRQAGDFRWAWHHPDAPQGAAERTERYVAPLYNALIARGCDIRYVTVERDAVIFCGTPAEYESVIGTPQILARLDRHA